MTPPRSLLLLPASLLLTGCLGGGPAETPADDAFATSGSPAADQRAEQELAKTAQVEEGDASGEESREGVALDPEAQKTLFDRLGGERGVRAVVDDFVPRVVADPRVNLQRVGVEGGWITAAPTPWEPGAAELDRVKELLVEFVSLAAGGPVTYSGPPLITVFEDRQFTNLEFDAAVGDLQASLDKLGLADQEQKELLAVMETVREQAVTVR